MSDCCVSGLGGPVVPGPGADKSIVGFGAGSVATTTTTRFLFPWYEDILAQLTVIRWRAPFPGTLRNLHVRHNIVGVGGAIVYMVNINGIPTLLLVSLGSAIVDGSNLVDSVAVVAGDLVAITVTKAVAITTSPTDITAVMELKAT